ncbi:MAG: hypothetical protein EXQ79_05615 [Acidimicrobiia bacterium]|nr:hypothetical protein [Acidimicrobiia bacterium]
MTEGVAEPLDTSTAKRSAQRALDLVPVLVAVVLIGGFVYSLVSIIFVAHPDIGWSEHVMADAKAIAHGHFPYGDPGEGYVGMLYTPLFPSIVAILLKITWWEGWGPFVSMVAAGTATFVLGRFVWRAGEDRPVSIARVAMVIAFPLSAFTIFMTNGVFEGRTDQLAWCFFVIAALRVLDDLRQVETARGVRGRIVTGVLLALSVLSKQTTLAACGVVAIVAAVSWWLASSTNRKRRLPIEGITMVGLVGIVLVALQVASDGFAFDLLFGVPRRHARVASVSAMLKTDLKLLVVPGVILLGVTIAAVVGTRRNARGTGGGDSKRWLRSPAAMAFVAAVLIGAATVPGTVLAQTKQGGDFNALAGPVWGMAIILAVALIAMPATWSRDAVRVIGAVLLLVGVVPLATTQNDLRRFDGRALGAPSLDLTRDWQSVPDDLVAAADHNRTVFDWEYPSYSVAADGPTYPGGGAPPDLAAAGYSPRWIVRDLLAGRWDRVRLYPTAPGAELGIIDTYASGFGQRDTAWAWKINEIIRRGYTKVEDARGGEDFYTPGPRLVDVQDLAECFGPYQAGPLSIRVRDGGGLWCIDSNTLSLDDGPNPTSELVLESSESATLHVTADDSNAVKITCDDPRLDTPVIRVRLGSGNTRECGNSVSLVVDVDAHVSIRGFSSGEQDVRVKLHNPKPSEL